ncbi:MAG: tetratricopeptide repeat protein [Caldilineaceae bacterium]|nr:tetratricopeptide repeat protein [Caldilineaceae bacterium]
MDKKLELALFGSPEVRLAGTPLTGFRSAKARALFYYLATTQRAHARSVLAGLFWGDVGDDYARRNLNRTLSNLTQLVGDHLVVSRHTLAFDRTRPYWLDVQALETALATAKTTGDPTPLAGVIELYRGDFLEGFYTHDTPEFEQWVLTERTRLREHYLQGLHLLSEHLASLGDFAGAVDAMHRVLKHEPWREEAHQQLMLLLAQSGQRSAALAQFELCRQALATELNVEPDTATLQLVARIRAGELDKVIPAQRTKRAEETPQETPPPEPLPPPADAEQPLPHNLPIQPTPFSGREAELAELTRLLDEPDCRLLTLVGPGGMGKTRLALRVAEGIVETHAEQSPFPHGVFFVPLDALREGSSIVSAIISAIADESGFPLHAAAPLQEQLLAFLRDKTMLLLLDNFEHLVSSAGLLSAILSAAPKLKLLVTSRETLGLQEEWYYPVNGMAFPPAGPDNAASDFEYDAVRFFRQCARRIQPALRLENERAAVIRICQMVEGMPLGIELAAAWLKALPPQQIVRELERGLDILTARLQNIPARHRSMRAVMDHSWSLLAEEEQEVAARLSVFTGGFQSEAAAEVAGASLPMLATLVEKAWVRVTPDRRYQMHELTRQYAAERLADTAPAIRDAHAAYYAALVDQQRANLYSPTYKQGLTVVSAELDNVRHAWRWMIDAVSQQREGLPVTALFRQMARVLTTYYLVNSLWLAGQALIDHAIQVMEAAGWGAHHDDAAMQHEQISTLVHVRLCTGLFHFEIGQYRASLAVAKEAIPVCRAYNLEHDLALALLLYGRTQLRRGVSADATATLQEAMALCRRLGDTSGSAEALLSLGMVASAQGRYPEAQAYLHEALALCKEMGYRPWVSRALTSLGTTYSRQHDYRHALPYYKQALTIAQEEGDQIQIMVLTSNLGSVERGFGRYQLSETYYNESLALARSLGDERWIAANLNGIAISYLEMHDFTAAERALREALAVAQRSESTPDTLGSIALLGHVLARRGQVEAALRALTFAEQHPSVMARDRLYNEPLLAELRSELPARLFDEATAWITHQSLDDIVHWLEYNQAGASN